MYSYGHEGGAEGALGNPASDQVRPGALGYLGAPEARRLRRDPVLETYRFARPDMRGYKLAVVAVSLASARRYVRVSAISSRAHGRETG